MATGKAKLKRRRKETADGSYEYEYLEEPKKKIVEVGGFQLARDQNEKDLYAVTVGGKRVGTVLMTGPNRYCAAWYRDGGGSGRAYGDTAAQAVEAARADARERDEDDG